VLVFLDIKSETSFTNLEPVLVVSNVNIQQRMADTILNASSDFLCILKQRGEVSLTHKMICYVSDISLISWLEN
jgi:hypothetical protein